MLTNIDNFTALILFVTTEYNVFSFAIKFVTNAVLLESKNQFVVIVFSTFFHVRELCGAPVVLSVQLSHNYNFRLVNVLFVCDSNEHMSLLFGTP